MNTNSNEQLPEFQYLGTNLRINFNEQVINSENEDGSTSVTYKYTTAVVPKSSSYDERVEAVIKTQYPTYGAELAAKNGTVLEVFEYGKLVAQAKHLTKKSLGLVSGEFNYVPVSISVRQARQQLIILGLLDQVETIIENTVDSLQKAVLRNYWEFSQVFERQNTVLIQLAQALNLTDAETDDLFYQAAQL